MAVPTSPRGHNPMWRSLDELFETEAFQQALQREFPAGAHVWGDASSRRGFLKRMAASIALAGLTGCVRQPDEAIVPYVDQLDEPAPGRPRHFATSIDVDGPLGLLVESHQGRPTKVEGNPDHPESLGATDAFAQASVLELYDPDRSQVVRTGHGIASRQAFFDDARPRLEAHRQRGGAGLHLLTESLSSPTILSQLAEIHTALPEARWYVHDAVSRRNVRLGTQQAFGQPLEPRYRLEDADVILAIDADFLSTGPGHVRLAREFAARRRVDAGKAADMSRLYALECTPTLTGASADHRRVLPPNELAALLHALASRLGDGAEGSRAEGEPWLEALAGDLRSAGARSALIPGISLPAELHALVHRINSQLGNVGTTVEYFTPGAAGDWPPEPLERLSEALEQGEVQTLLVLGGNPVFTAPADLNFAALLERAGQTWHHGLWYDETAALCNWHIPGTHFLESWSDHRGLDGTAGIVQPLIAPLYDGLSLTGLLNLVLNRSNQTDYQTVRDFWRGQMGEQDFENNWRRAVHDGVVPNSRNRPAEVSVGTADAPADNEQAAESASRGETGEGESFEVVFRPHPTVYDGRFANNGWLQELPQPLTKLTWSNPALVSYDDAQRLGIRNGDVLRLSAGERSLELPAWVLPGQAHGIVTLHFGQGRSRAGRNGNGIGANVYALRTRESVWTLPGVRLQKVDRTVALPTTQEHQLMEGRDLVRTGTLEEWNRDPEHPGFAHPAGHHVPLADDGEPASMYPDYEQDGPQWGMSINLGACTGCSACVVACQAENNIPIVGPDEVLNGREMHWLRIDTYYSGEPAAPAVHHQPVLCMHCEHAPCEPVCPVAATTHSSEGLNEMTYNRCIGTRYCSNNCPYKVRRFNYYDYHAQTRELPVLHLLQNPDVSVRSRGVMEKCTYCVQRISAARIQAGMEGRYIRDGEVVTACQGACPTQAIVFGDISDSGSHVAEAKAHPLTYGLLAELNTRPRTTYQAAVRNPNPNLMQES